MQKKDTIASVVKASRILSCFDMSHKELSLVELSRMTGYPKTTVFGFVSTLLQENMLARIASSDQYTLGTRLLELAYYTKSTIPIIQIATPMMSRLNELSGQNVYLTTHIRGRLMYLESYYRDREYVGYSESGKTMPMHCAASGKAILAFMKKEQVDTILEEYPLIPMTPNSLTDRDAFLRELEQIRSQGYAVDNEEVDIGVKCLGVPVLNRQGEPVGAISLSGSAAIMTEEKCRECYELVSTQMTVLRLNADLFPCQYL